MRGALAGRRSLVVDEEERAAFLCAVVMVAGVVAARRSGAGGGAGVGEGGRVGFAAAGVGEGVVEAHCWFWGFGRGVCWGEGFEGGWWVLGVVVEGLLMMRANE